MIWVSIGVLSCDYEPTGTNFVKIDSTYTPAPIELILPDDNTDTLRAFTKRNNDMYYASIGYKVKADKSKFSSVKFYFDDVEKSETGYMSGTFNVALQKEDLNKIHKIELIAKTSSGTGSIADKMKQEGVKLSKTWMFIPLEDITDFASDYLQKFELVYTRENDGLHLHWDTTNINLFARVSLFRVYPSSKTVFLSNLKLGDMSYIDTNYLGEQAYYYVQFEVNGQTYQSKTLKVIKDLPTLSIEPVNSTTVKVKWQKTKYKENFGYYYINNSKGDLDPVEINDINQTELTMNNITFGTAVTVYFYVMPKSGEKRGLNDPDFYSSLSVSNGEPAFPFYGKPIIASDFVIAKTSDVSFNYVIRDIKTFQVMDSSKFEYTPLEGKLSTTERNVIFRSGDTYYFEPFHGDFKSLKSQGIYYFSGKNYTSYVNRMKGLAISDQNTFLVNQGNDIYLFNYVNRHTNAKLTFSSEPESLDITPDSKHAFIKSGSELYDYDLTTGKFNLIKKISGAQSYILLKNEYKILFSNGQNLIKYDIESSSFKTVASTNSSILNADFDSGVLLVYDGATQMLSVLDMNNSFNVIKTIKASPVNYFVKGDYIYSEQGYRINFRK